MHCLFVKAPFAGWIVDRVKWSEYRTRKTLIRGRIGIIESGTSTVIGDVDLVKCIKGPTTQTEGLYVWMLNDARRYSTPVPFEHKRGCVTWAILDIDPDKQELAPQLDPETHSAVTEQYRAMIGDYLDAYKKHHPKNRGRSDGH